jgi:hypothetical protein
MPSVIGFVAILLIVIQVPAVQSTGSLQIALLLGLPLLVGWFFHGVLLAPVTHVRFLWRRLPQVLLAANIGMGSISVLAVPLINQSIRVCSILPLSAWAVLTWWAIVALSTPVAVLILFLYENWAVSRGFRAWSVLAGSSGEVHSPSWRKLWWWILLSYVALLGGLAAGVILSQLLAG